MDDLEALFSSMDDFKDDLMDFGIAGVGGIGATIAWGYVENNWLGAVPVIGQSPIARAIVTVVAGVAGGAALSKMNKNLATGVAVALSMRGIAALVRAVSPDVATKVGLSDGDLGLTWYDQKLLKEAQRRGIAGAPTMVEEVSGLNAATATIEQMAGLQELASTFQ